MWRSTSTSHRLPISGRAWRPAFGSKGTLYPHPQDTSALGTPEWEDFDGEYPSVNDGAGFLSQVRQEAFRCPVVHVKLGGAELRAALELADAGDRRSLYRLLARDSSTVRLEPFLVHQDIIDYWPVAQALARHDAIMTINSPVMAYLSGRPYLAQSIGGDMKVNCSRSDWYGHLVSLAFNAARFITFTNLHPVAHFRRLGFTQGLYLPYAMDEDRYCPGHGQARARWVAEYGEGIYVLSTARIDNAIKGNGEALFGALVEAARRCPQLRYVFLQWGHSARALSTRFTPAASLRSLSS